MKDLRIEKIGCHASKCANKAGPYRHMSAARCYEIQNRLIVDIVAAELYGVVATIDMAAYMAHKDVLLKFLSKHDRQWFHPHAQAVIQCMQQMCNATAGATDEPIAFVVDRNDAFGGRARFAFDLAANNPGNAHYARLSSYTEADRMNAVGLQAADMLTYSAFRHANEKNGGKACWQWKDLRPAIKADELTTGMTFWAELTRRVQAVAHGELGVRSKPKVPVAETSSGT
jgi:hypothetical protein